MPRPAPRPADGGPGRLLSSAISQWEEIERGETLPSRQTAAARRASEIEPQYMEIKWECDLDDLAEAERLRLTLLDQRVNGKFDTRAAFAANFQSAFLAASGAQIKVIDMASLETDANYDEEVPTTTTTTRCTNCTAAQVELKKTSRAARRFRLSEWAAAFAAPLLISYRFYASTLTV